MPRHGKPAQTTQTTAHLSLINRLFLDTRSARERRSLSATLDMIVDRVRLESEASSCPSPIYHVTAASATASR